MPRKKYQVPKSIKAMETKTKSVARKLENVVVPVKIMWKKFTAKNIPTITKSTR
jgi:hypothetical protein